MIMCSNTTWPPYVSLVANVKFGSYHHIKLDMGLKPNQAARMVARIRHQVKLPLVVEMETNEIKSRLVRLAQAVAAAGANVIMLTAGDFTSAKAALSDLSPKITLPLFVRCPITTSDEQQELQALGAAQVIPSMASELVLAATN